MPTPFRVPPRTLEEFFRALTLTATSAPSTDFCVAVELLIAMCVLLVGLAERICSHNFRAGAVALDPETVDALRRHRDAQLLERDFAGPAYVDRDFVFCDEIGGPIYPNRLTDWFRRHRQAAGIPTGSLHTLRHSVITLMLTGGIPVHVVAARVGDTPTTVLSSYAHLLPQSDELAAERVAAVLTSPS